MSDTNRNLDPIRSFQKDFRFLSNFWPAIVMLDGETYPTVEHAYQAAKTLYPEVRTMIRELEQPGRAKGVGATLDLRPDWEEGRVTIMNDLTQQKYSHPDLAARLLATGRRSLFEGNT